MGHVSINQIVESRLNTSWGVTTPIHYENVDFTPPVGSSWISCAVKETDSKKITLGSGAQVRRTIGSIFIEIFVPLGFGSVGGRTYADQIKSIFRDYRSSGLHCQEFEIYWSGESYYTNSGSGIPATSQWYSIKMAGPFRYDETV